VKDDEFEGDEPVQKALKGTLPPLLGGMPNGNKLAFENQSRFMRS
jgi:hypothetical protein